LQYAVLEAKRNKNIDFLQQAIHDAVCTPGIPTTFPAIVNATEQLFALQNESRFRLKFFLKTLDLEKVKANGLLGVAD